MRFAAGFFGRRVRGVRNVMRHEAGCPGPARGQMPAMGLSWRSQALPHDAQVKDSDQRHGAWVSPCR